MRALVIFFILISSTLYAQKAPKFQTVVIKTSAECGDCKDRIEGYFNYIKGVKFAELDVPSKNLTIKFATSKFTLQEIKERVTQIGYDADELKANPEAQKKLPLCCQPGGMGN